MSAKRTTEGVIKCVQTNLELTCVNAITDSPKQVKVDIVLTSMNVPSTMVMALVKILVSI